MCSATASAAPSARRFKRVSRTEWRVVVTVCSLRTPVTPPVLLFFFPSSLAVAYVG